MVEQIDVNVSFYDHLLNKNDLPVYYDQVKLKFKELDSRKELSTELKNQYAALEQFMLSGIISLWH